MRVLGNVRQVTIKPILEQFVVPETLINTHEYDIYGRLTEWGFEHKSVCHDHGEYARDEVMAWATHCNAKQKGVQWQLKVENARIKLHSLYPKIKS